jgi:TPR repeat protein
LSGAGGPKNKEEAIDWLKKSSAQGYPPATSLLKKIQE